MNLLAVAMASWDGQKLDRWQEALESKGFKINHTKTEYMDCNFSGHIEKAEKTVRIEAHEIPCKEILSVTLA